MEGGERLMKVVKDPDNERAETFTRLVEQHQKTLLNISYMYLKDRTLAEDAVQETFIKAYNALPRFRGECTEKTWLTRILMNTCRDMNKNAWFVHVNRAVQPEDLPECAALQNETEQSELSEILWRLPRKYREILLLYYYQDFTMPEIGDMLHISVSTVSRRIHTACSRLEQALRKEGIPWMKSV